MVINEFIWDCARSELTCSPRVMLKVKVKVRVGVSKP